MPAIRVRPDDVFIVSYPKSGNTWIRFLLAHLLAPADEITFRNIDDYVPDLYKRSENLDGQKGRRYIKSHHPSYDLYPKMIYIYRDGRDALVSYYNYASGKGRFDGDFGDFVFSSFAAKFSTWREHVEAAHDFASKHPERVLMLQYEQMLENPLPAAERISQFLELNCKDSVIAQAVTATSFDQLQKMEHKAGGEKTAKAGTFFRSGKTGQWRDLFDAELYRKYCEQNGPTLLRLGYQL